MVDQSAVFVRNVKSVQIRRCPRHSKIFFSHKMDIALDVLVKQGKRTKTPKASTPTNKSPTKKTRDDPLGVSLDDLISKRGGKGPKPKEIKPTVAKSSRVEKRRFLGKARWSTTKQNRKEFGKASDKRRNQIQPPEILKRDLKGVGLLRKQQQLLKYQEKALLKVRSTRMPDITPPPPNMLQTSPTANRSRRGPFTARTVRGVTGYNLGDRDSSPSVSKGRSPLFNQPLPVFGNTYGGHSSRHAAEDPAGVLIRRGGTRSTGSFASLDERYKSSRSNVFDEKERQLLSKIKIMASLDEKQVVVAPPSRGRTRLSDRFTVL